MQEPGASGVHGHQEERPAADGRPSSSPSASAHNGVPDFPDPTPNGPLVDTNRIPSAATIRRDERSARRDAEVPQLRGGGRECGASEAQDVGAGRSCRPGCRYGHRRRGRDVRREASSRGRRRSRPANTAQVEQRALSATVSEAGTLTYRAQSDGSPYSVINQARGTYTKLPAARPGDLSGSGALPGERQPGGVAVRLDTRLSDPVGRRDRPRRGRAQRGSGRARLRHLGSAQPTLRLLRVGDHHGLGEAPGRPGGDPERHADSRPGGVRAHRRAGDGACQPSSGAAPRPARR